MHTQTIPTILTLRRNLTHVDVGQGLELWYSYRTVVAFRHVDRYGARVVVRENDWGPTTGRHLNEIDGGSKDARSLRIAAAEFERRLLEASSAPMKEAQS